MREPEPPRTEAQFIDLLCRLVIAEQPNADITAEPLVAPRVRPDLLIRIGSTLYIVEAKRVPPQTMHRISDVREQLQVYRDAISKVYPTTRLRMVLATPGTLSADKRAFLASESIDVWDKGWVFRAGKATGLGDAVTEFYLGRSVEPPASDEYKDLQDRILTMPPGRKNWSAYQATCKETWERLFFPELSPPISESANQSRVNRRDFVVPNYANSGFWLFLRSHYSADYIVIDAKNLSGTVGKSHVLQICNYMSRQGTGLFGVIMSRRGADRAADYTRREQWVLYNKMLIVIDDADAIQMLENKRNNEDPTLVIRQKIEDFRLAI